MDNMSFKVFGLYRYSDGKELLLSWVPSEKTLEATMRMAIDVCGFGGMQWSVVTKYYRPTVFYKHGALITDKELLDEVKQRFHKEMLSTYGLTYE